MILGLFLVCFVALCFTTLLLLTLGRRVRFSSLPLSALIAASIALGAGALAGRIWHLSVEQVRAGVILLGAAELLVITGRRRWNVVGQVFFGSLVAAAVTYLSFALWYTLFGGLSPIGALASGMLFVLEATALFLSLTFVFESCDVICRTRWDRRIRRPDPDYRPKVSLQIAAYNEPPDMLIKAIASAEALDYPDFEIVVIDNNTKDPDVWRPVEEYCRDRPRVHFVHVDPWPGYKSGALNLALSDYTSTDAELVGVIDADYLLDPAYLRSVVGYFADPDLAFLQTPQDYREYRGDTYLTACYDAYRYFFASSMISRNERNSIIFAGTMGLIRRSILQKLGGWDEWCITEDAEASLRMLREGYSGLYVDRSFGRGIMPLTFASLKSQRFRWCFGGMQILRRHWRELVPWNRDPENHLSLAQRWDYLIGSLQWLNDLVYLGFSVVLLTTGALLLTKGHVGIRPLLGAVVLLPAALVGSGLLRAVWALRVRTGIGMRRALRAFANWLSLSWTVSLACLQGLLRSKGAFLRTPKTADRRTIWSAIWAARSESLLALALWCTGVAVGLHGRGATPFVVGLFAYQGAAYATSPYMSWLNSRSRLSEELERRRRTERTREERIVTGVRVAGGVAGVAGLITLAVVMLLGGSHPGTPRNPFKVQQQAPAQQGGVPVPGGPGSPTSTPSPSPTTSPTASPTVSPTTSPTASPTTSPTASPTVSPSGSPSPSPSQSASP